MRAAPAGVRLALVAAAVVVACAALVVVGRAEGRRFVDDQTQGQRQLLGAIGNNWRSPSLSAYRLARPRVCLLYDPDHKGPYAVEFCFDRAGRLIEAIDRRSGGRPNVFSLRSKPEAARLGIPPGELQGLLRRLGVAAQLRYFSVTDPFAVPDVGPALPHGYAAVAPPG